MWTVFFRLLAAHLFSDFPLRHFEKVEQLPSIRRILVHGLFIFLTSTFAIGSAVIYRIELLGMIGINTAIHIIVDFFFISRHFRNIRNEVLSNFIYHIITIVAIFGLSYWFTVGYSYGNLLPFIIFNLAIISLWVNPHILFIIRRIRDKASSIGIFHEPWAKWALLERALLFMGFSVKNIVLCIIGILIAIIIRALLLLNEENVPVPIVEWLVVIAAALVGRYFMYGVIL